LLSAPAPHPDPLADALRRKRVAGEPGAARTSIVASGDGWRVVDVVCTTGPDDRPYAERQIAMTVSLVLRGTFLYRSARGTSLLSPGALLLGNLGDGFKCSHEHGEGDRCLSFQFDTDYFARLAHDAGAAAPAFSVDRLPANRALAPAVARAAVAADRAAALEELALDVAGAALHAAAPAARTSRAAPEPARVARVLREVEPRIADRHTLADLAATADMSPYHFLRTFKAVTGTTPHQWLLRARLRDAARRLAGTAEPITAIALDTGFDDLSNFIRTFRAEFGVSPRRYRAGT